jgi:hypothetical protein
MEHGLLPLRSKVKKIICKIKFDRMVYSSELASSAAVHPLILRLRLNL